MKKIIVTGAVAAITAVSFAGAASAAPSERACFGQTHKAVNAGAAGVDNVGQLVQGELVASFGNKGQGKKALVNTVFCP